MAREINDKQQFTDKLVKFIPTEIVGAYMILMSVIGFQPGTADIPPDSMASNMIQVVFFALFILTPIYLWKVSNVKHKLQLGISTLSYAVWVYTLGGPFVIWEIYDPLISAVTLILWSLIPPLLIQAEPSQPVPEN